jgi:hypothetical protein
LDGWGIPDVPDVSGSLGTTSKIVIEVSVGVLGSCVPMREDFKQDVKCSKSNSKIY